MKAFTLIELLIVMAILVLLAGVGFFGILNYKNNQSINSTSQQIATVLRNAQNRSLSQESASRWGVHFENPAGGAGFYSLFMGASYDASVVVSKNVLPAGIQFNAPASNSSSTVIFSPISGLPDNSVTIKISITAQPSASSTIIVNQNGEILY